MDSGERESPIWSKTVLSSAAYQGQAQLTNGEPYDKDTVIYPTTFINGPFYEAGTSNNNWMKETDEIHSSLENTSSCKTRPITQLNPLCALYDIRDNNIMTQPSSFYSGVIRNSRFDFVTEEPQNEKLKKIADNPAEATPNQEGSFSNKNRKEMEDASLTRLETVTMIKNLTGFSGAEKNADVSEDSSSIQPTIYGPGPAWPPVAADGVNSYPQAYSKLQYSWPGQSHDNESSASIETYMIERPPIDGMQYTQSTAALTSMAPSMNAFSTPFDQYGYRGMTCFPLMYPPALPPYLQYYSMYADPYCLLRERYKDVEPYMFPTFIQPKPFTSSFSFRPLTESLQPSLVPYPNPAAMFQAANLVPPFINTNPILSKSIAVTNTSYREPCTPKNEDEYNKIQARPSSQSTWFKGDNGFSYTVAAAPSDVMTYIPQTTNEEHDADTSSSSSSTDDDNDDDDSQKQENPCLPIKDLVVKKKKTPSRKPHECDICGKTYARAFTLKTHKRIHTGERPFTCKICFKTFAQGGGLDSHIRVHTGEKPYKCPVCARAFSHSSAVKSHLRRHTGEKPFICTVCRKKFGDQSTLTKHNRIHTGEKPFKCHICQVTFTQIGNMNKHLKSIHGHYKNHGYSVKREKNNHTKSPTMMT